MTTAQNVALALTTRLHDITIANGYATDAGIKVYRGRRRLMEQHLPCIVIVERPDEVADHTRLNAKITARYDIEGHSVCDPDSPNDKAHDLIGDIKRAVFGAPWLAVDGSQLPIRYERRVISPREDGHGVIAAAVSIVVEYAEKLSQP